MHEFVASAAKLKKEKGISAMDIAKRLLDFGFHAPTVYFPLTVPEAMMIEPTETESKETLDAFAETLFRITDEAEALLHEAPHSTLISRPDEVRSCQTAGYEMDARLIIDEPASGSWNMALDEALLESAGTNKRATLRFYRWSEPTLSLGYFQRLEDRHQHVASRDCALVRRGSGGGAILHDHELTYSFVAPVTDRVGANVEQLYDVFHETLVEELSSRGVRATLCESPSKVPRDEELFLCFQRRSIGDVLFADSKICGSAQRRHQGAVLQHGSLLLEASPCAPELPGIREVSGVIITPEEFYAPLAERELRVS